MILETVVVGFYEVNCYILGNEKTKEAIIIDPGADYEKIKLVLARHNLLPCYIINTHGHGDHIGANGSLSVPIYIHRDDADFLQDPKRNLSSFLGFSLHSPPATHLLNDGQQLNLIGFTLNILHTPGHTPGGICIRLDKILFTGDTLFAGSIGRTDFPYGNEEILLNSIKTKLLALDDDTLIYPGHGDPSTIKRERKTNPFLLG